MKARDIMTTEHLWGCSETDTARQVAELMSDHGIGALPILDAEGRLEGIVTDRDICCRVVAQNLPDETPVGEIMSTSVQTVFPDAGLSEVESIMRDFRIRRLPVVDEQNKLLGFISLGDLARHVRGLFKEHGVYEVLEAVSSPGGPSST